MRKVTSQIFCAFLMLLLWASGAVASTSHHHKGMGSALESHSPFHQHQASGSAVESENDHRRLCRLKHHQKGLPCPHEKKHIPGEGLAIGTDCGGMPSGSFPISVDFSKNLFFDLNLSLFGCNENSADWVLYTSTYTFSLSHPIDHPPKFL